MYPIDAPHQIRGEVNRKVVVVIVHVLAHFLDQDWDVPRRRRNVSAAIYLNWIGPIDSRVLAGPLDRQPVELQHRRRSKLKGSV